MCRDHLERTFRREVGTDFRMLAAASAFNESDRNAGSRVQGERSRFRRRLSAPRRIRGSFPTDFRNYAQSLDVGAGTAGLRIEVLVRDSLLERCLASSVAKALEDKCEAEGGATPGERLVARR